VLNGCKILANLAMAVQYMVVYKLQRACPCSELIVALRTWADLMVVMASCKHSDRLSVNLAQPAASGGAAHAPFHASHIDHLHVCLYSKHMNVPPV
jgi:hypothetical protein